MVARTRLASQRFRKITRRLLLSRSPYWRRGAERTGARKYRSLLRKIDQRARAFRSYLPSRGRTAEYLRLDSRPRAYPWHCGRSLQTYRLVGSGYSRHSAGTRGLGTVGFAESECRRLGSTRLLLLRADHFQQDSEPAWLLDTASMTVIG